MSEVPLHVFSEGSPRADKVPEACMLKSSAVCGSGLKQSITGQKSTCSTPVPAAKDVSGSLSSETFLKKENDDDLKEYLTKFRDLLYQTILDRKNASMEESDTAGGQEGHQRLSAAFCSTSQLLSQTQKETSIQPAESTGVGSADDESGSTFDCQLVELISALPDMIGEESLNLTSRSADGPQENNSRLELLNCIKEESSVPSPRISHCTYTLNGCGHPTLNRSDLQDIQDLSPRSTSVASPSLTPKRLLGPYRTLRLPRPKGMVGMGLYGPMSSQGLCYTILGENGEIEIQAGNLLKPSSLLPPGSSNAPEDYLAAVSQQYRDLLTVLVKAALAAHQEAVNKEQAVETHLQTTLTGTVDNRALLFEKRIEPKVEASESPTNTDFSATHTTELTNYAAPIVPFLPTYMPQIVEPFLSAPNCEYNKIRREVIVSWTQDGFPRFQKFSCKKLGKEEAFTRAQQLMLNITYHILRSVFPKAFESIPPGTPTALKRPSSDQPRCRSSVKPPDELVYENGQLNGPFREYYEQPVGPVRGHARYELKDHFKLQKLGKPEAAARAERFVNLLAAGDAEPQVRRTSKTPIDGNYGHLEDNFSETFQMLTRWKQQQLNETNSSEQMKDPQESKFLNAFSHILDRGFQHVDHQQDQGSEIMVDNKVEEAPELYVLDKEPPWSKPGNIKTCCTTDGTQNVNLVGSRNEDIEALWEQALGVLLDAPSNRLTTQTTPSPGIEDPIDNDQESEADPAFGHSIYSRDECSKDEKQLEFVITGPEAHSYQNGKIIKYHDDCTNSIPVSVRSKRAVEVTNGEAVEGSSKRQQRSVSDLSSTEGEDYDAKKNDSIISSSFSESLLAHDLAKFIQEKKLFQTSSYSGSTTSVSSGPASSGDTTPPLLRRGSQDSLVINFVYTDKADQDPISTQFTALHSLYHPFPKRSLSFPNSSDLSKYHQQDGQLSPQWQSLVSYLEQKTIPPTVKHRIFGSRKMSVGINQCGTINFEKHFISRFVKRSQRNNTASTQQKVSHINFTKEQNLPLLHSKLEPFTTRLRRNYWHRNSTQLNVEPQPTRTATSHMSRSGERKANRQDQLPVFPRWPVLGNSLPYSKRFLGKALYAFKAVRPTREQQELNPSTNQSRRHYSSTKEERSKYDEQSDDDDVEEQDPYDILSQLLRTTTAGTGVSGDDDFGFR